MKASLIKKEYRRKQRYIRNLKLERELRKTIVGAAPDILASEHFESTKDYLQHGNITVNKHCMNVARISIRINRALRAKCKEEQLIRGALLHDYFLYDWHIPDEDNPHRLHGFIHAKRALENAQREFDLTEIEREIIIKHMWPLNPAVPMCREAWVVTTADKWCSLLETLHIYKGHGKRK